MKLCVQVSFAHPMIFAKLQLWALLLLSLTSAFRYEPTSELLDDKIFYPKLIEVAKQAVENYNKFKTAFEYQQVRNSVLPPKTC